MKPGPDSTAAAAIGGTGEPYTQQQPKITDRCPTCGARSLFIGAGGFLTCSVIGCKNPAVGEAMVENNIVREFLKSIAIDLANVVEDLLYDIDGGDGTSSEFLLRMDARGGLHQRARAALSRALEVAK